jgi:hypothetical protein
MARNHAESSQVIFVLLCVVVLELIVEAPGRAVSCPTVALSKRHCSAISRGVPQSCISHRLWRTFCSQVWSGHRSLVVGGMASTSRPLFEPSSSLNSCRRGFFMNLRVALSEKDEWGLFDMCRPMSIIGEPRRLFKLIFHSTEAGVGQTGQTIVHVT